MVVFFFFKQKTAYEMRISDWSSDVCSSDLRHRAMSNTRDQYPGRVSFDRVPVPGVDPDRIPTHVACVMDGNGRWATRRGLKRTEGHAAGEEALFDAVEGALELGVRWLTVYAFSTENWRRPVDEVRFLMGFNEIGRAHV